MRQILRWLLRNRKTGAITIVQAPNLVLWMVMAAAALRWFWPPAGSAGVALTIAVKGGLLVWSLDEILRGVNPWRRCLGAAVLGYELVAFL